MLKAARVPAATLMMASLLAWPLVAQEWRPESSHLRLTRRPLSGLLL